MGIDEDAGSKKAGIFNLVFSQKMALNILGVPKQ